MTIAWTTDPGGLFLTLGHIFKAIDNVQTRRGSALTTEINNIIAGYTTAQRPYYDGIRGAQDAYVGAHDSYISALKEIAKTTITKIVQADNPQPNTNMTTIMTEVIRQMVAASQTVDQSVVGSTVTAGGSNVGNPTVLCSTTGRNGRPLEYAYAETLVGVVPADRNGAGSGTVTAGQEQIAITGAAALSNKFDKDWPDGSGANTSITMVDPTQDAAGGNLLTNSNFVTYTVANTPDDWTILVGSAGTNILRSTSTVYASSAASLQIAGQAATLTAIAQTFGTDTAGTVKPATVYAVNLKYYVDVQPVAGVLKVELVDGSNTVINDDFGTANAITLTVSAAAATAWTSLSGFFRTPTNLPSTVKIRIRLSTAMTAGSNVFINYMGMTEATQLYTAGPYVAAFRGSADVIFGDRWTIAVTNDGAGLIQRFFEQTFDMSSMGLILPSVDGGGETIADSLVA